MSAMASTVASAASASPSVLPGSCSLVPLALTQASPTKELVQLAAGQLGKCDASVAPFIDYLTGVEWLETCRDVLEASLDTDTWAGLRLPAKLKLKVKQLARQAQQVQHHAIHVSHSSSPGAGGGRTTAAAAAAGDDDDDDDDSLSYSCQHNL